MGLFDTLFTEPLKAVKEYSNNHKKHMQEQWEKQAERSKAQEPRPLTETQLAWQRLQQEQERAAAQQVPALRDTSAAAAATVARSPSAPVTSTPVFTITWHVRLSSLGNIPLPWASMQ